MRESLCGRSLLPTLRLASKLTESKKTRSALQWFGLLLAITGLSTGLYLFADFVFTVAQPALQSGNMPVVDFATNLRVMIPLVLGIIGVNLFIHKDKTSEGDD